MRLKQFPIVKQTAVGAVSNSGEGRVDISSCLPVMVFCQDIFPLLKFDFSEFQVSDLKMPFHDSNVYIVV